jgi:hypothetical protein
MRFYAAIPPLTAASIWDFAWHQPHSKIARQEEESWTFLETQNSASVPSPAVYFLPQLVVSRKEEGRHFK